MKNAYQTNDPQKLLQLKRLEAAALLDVLRTINHYEHSIPRLCRIAQNVLRAQLGVKKMSFYFKNDHKWEQGFSTGFGQVDSESSVEMFQAETTQQVTLAYMPALFASGVEFVIAITNKEEIFAYFLIADFADSEMEAQNDIIFIETLGNILAVAIRNKQLFEEMVAQEFLKKELEVAATIQQQLLISDFERFKEIDVFGMNEAHHGIGGDFFDVLKKSKGITYVCIADVSGKGIGAALLMSNLQANLRSLSAQYDSPAQIVKELNSILFGITTGEKFVTLFLARLDTQLGSFTYVNAGHNYPIFLRKGQVRRLDTGCVLLGIIPEIEPEEANHTFSEGDILFMFTDGLVEQTNDQDEMYSSEKVVEELMMKTSESAAEIVEHMTRSVDEFAGDTEVLDDVTMLCVKFLSNSK